MNFKPVVPFILCCVVLGEFTAQENRPVSTWKDYFPYSEVLEAITGSDGQGDDIVLRQIRDAASKEQDPVLREKLWDEYRRIKNQS